MNPEFDRFPLPEATYNLKEWCTVVNVVFSLVGLSTCLILFQNE